MSMPERFRMQITYPDGTFYEGKKDFFQWTDLLGITNFNFKRKRVLDIATDEGWWAFWAEMGGADYVEASDVELGEDYDWGAEKDWEWINGLNAARGGRKVFDFHHKNLNSKIVVKKESIYDVKVQFDVVFCHGLLYHLRHPLLAIERTKAVCDGIAIFESFIDVKSNQYIAQSKFYRTTELGPVSNWTGATPACYASWMKDAGYKHIFITKENLPRPTRAIFVCLSNDDEFDRFVKNENLIYCDDEYWNTVYESTSFKSKS